MAARARVGSDMWGRCGIRRARGTRWAGADNLCRRTWWAVWSWTRRSWSWSGWAVWTWARRAGNWWAVRTRALRPRMRNWWAVRTRALIPWVRNWWAIRARAWRLDRGRYRTSRSGTHRRASDLSERAGDGQGWLPSTSIADLDGGGEVGWNNWRRERFLATGISLRDGEGLCLATFRAGRLCWADLNELGRVNSRIGQILCWSWESYTRSADGRCKGSEIGTISKEADHSSLSGVDGSCGNDVV